MTSHHEEFELKERPRASADEARAAFPGVAAAVDAFKAVFGDGVKVIAFEENGKRHQARSYKPESAYRGCLSASQFIRLGDISRENTAMLAKREADRGRK